MSKRTDKIKMTNAIVSALAPPEGCDRFDFWDSEQNGFGVRISKAKTKTFFVMTRVNTSLVRSTVGKFPAMSVSEARTRARKMLVDMADGINPNDAKKARRSGELTLAGVFKTFMETRKDRRQELTERTEEHYQRLFDKHLSVWKSRHVGEITAAMCHDLHQAIATKAVKTITYTIKGHERSLDKERGGTNVANQALRLLRRLLNFSRGRHEIPVVNPVTGVEWFTDGRRQVVIKPGDFPGWFKIVNELANETARDYLLLVLFTGLRRNEAFSLTWDNIDLEERFLMIPGPLTKNGEPHSLPLSDFLYRLLADRQERWGATTGYVFPSWSKSGHLANVQHSMKILQEAGYPYTLHDLRRTFITTAESLDISIYAVKRLANHKQQDVTGKHYIVFDVDRLREPMEKISRELLRKATEIKRKVIPLRQAA